MKKYRLFTAIFSALVFLSMPLTVFSDVGPKPSVTVHVKNFTSQDYYLDLLEKSEDSFYENLSHGYPESYKELALYKYREDNWMAKHIRYHLLFGKLKGEYDRENSMMVHRFSYHGVPQTFKVIVQDASGNLIVSNEVTPNQFNASVLFDMQTGKLTVVKGIYLDFMGNMGALLVTVVICMLLTVLIEAIIAIPFRIIRPLKLVIAANLITQALLHTVLIGLYYAKQYDAMHNAFIISEVSVLVIEYFIYRRVLPEAKTKTLVSYVLIANLSTFLLGLVIQI